MVTRMQSELKGSDATDVERKSARRRRACAAPAQGAASSSENAIRWVEPKRERGSAAPNEAGADAGRRSQRQPSAPADRKPADRLTTSDHRAASFASLHAVPDVVQRRFVQVGRDYYFADGARAFTDRGAKLSTPSENTQLIRDLVLVAQTRGWETIAVSGTARFRKEAWAAGQAAGLTVRGYRPTAFEQAHWVRGMARHARDGVEPAIGDEGVRPMKSGADAGAPSARESRDKASRDEAFSESRERRHVGRLVDHGPAPYRQEPQAPMSYVVKLETARGDRELWGVDLQRALRESLSQPKIGDEVVLRAVRQEPVRVTSRRRDQQGRVVGEQALETHRNRWSVEKKTFLTARATAARTLRDASIAAAQGSARHPELLGAYLQMHAAELAARQFRDVEDQRRFVALVRGTLADSVARGDPLVPVRIHEEMKAQPTSRALTRDRDATARSMPERTR